MDYYRLPTHEVIRVLETSPHGLTSDQVTQRRARSGLNELPETHPPSLLYIFIQQFKSPLIYVLLIAALIIFFVGPDTYDAFIISGILLFNALIGTFQEGRTQAILKSLKRFLMSECIVIRDGKKVRIPSNQLVVGDYLMLTSGQRVPADARLVETHNFTIDESMLTGESAPIEKNEREVDQKVAITEQTCMVFSGTYVLTGMGHALVTNIGLATQVGSMHATITQIHTNTPLKQELNRLSYHLLIVILGMCCALLGIGVIGGKPLRELLVMLTALFICAIPEGLPVVLTLILVTGVYRLAQQKVLIKNMQAVEGLGRTDIIVTDKTGTLTRNQMMVYKIYADEQEWHVSGDGYDPRGTISTAHDANIIALNNSILIELGKAIALLNTTHISTEPESGLFVVEGDPTEAALSIMARKLNLTKEALEHNYQHLYTIPFDSALQYQAAFFQHNDAGIAYVIGAPELIMQRCKKLSDQPKHFMHQFLEEGLRLIAVATKTFNTDVCHKETSDANTRNCYQNIVEHDLHFLGLCGMQDAIRTDIKDSIAYVQSSGIRVVMATGDHAQTAMHVARSVGIINSSDKDQHTLLLDGPTLEQMNDQELRTKINAIKIFARVLPEHKLRIINAYHAQKHLVAMTGDGINDVPSLIAADLGIAMGQIGTEVAKNASDIILLDDSFINIVHAIEQGRHIFYTLKRVVLYFFATNFGEILVIVCTMASNLPLPLLPAQILWLNLVTDGFLDMAIATEPRESNLLTKAWRHTYIRLVDWDLIGRMLFMASVMAIGSFLVFMCYYSYDYRLAQTMTLMTMAMFSWFNAWNCRSMGRSIFSLGIATNRWLILAAGFVLLLQALLIYTPFMNRVFKTTPLSFYNIMVIIGVSSSIIVAEEIRKYIARH